MKFVKVVFAIVATCAQVGEQAQASLSWSPIHTNRLPTSPDSTPSNINSVPIKTKSLTGPCFDLLTPDEKCSRRNVAIIRLTSDLKLEPVLPTFAPGGFSSPPPAVADEKDYSHEVISDVIAKSPHVPATRRRDLAVEGSHRWTSAGPVLRTVDAAAVAESVDGSAAEDVWVAKLLEAKTRSKASGESWSASQEWHDLRSGHANNSNSNSNSNNNNNDNDNDNDNDNNSNDDNKVSGSRNVDSNGIFDPSDGSIAITARDKDAHLELFLKEGSVNGRTFARSCGPSFFGFRKTSCTHEPRNTGDRIEVAREGTITWSLEATDT